MWCSSTKYPIAKKEHTCTNCCEKILVGEKYARWTSFGDSAFDNKMHIECLDSFEEDSEGRGWDYSPYSGERPKKVNK